MVNFRPSEIIAVLLVVLMAGQAAAMLLGDSGDWSSGMSVPGPETLVVLVASLIAFGTIIAGQRAAPARRRRVNRARLRARRAAS